MSDSVLDKSSFAKLSAILSRLTSLVILLDENGNNLLAENHAAEEIPESLELGKPQVIGNKTWLLACDAPIEYIVVHGVDAASVDCALITQSLIRTIAAAVPYTDMNSALRSVLLDEMQQPMLDATATDNHIPQELLRLVMIFHMSPSATDSAAEVLTNLIPLDCDDILVEINRSTLALIKTVDSADNLDDMAEFGNAVEQTLEAETAAKIKVAIGEPKLQFSKLAESYKEAWRALMVGHVYKPETQVYLYRRLALERFLMEMPREIGKYYHHLLFNRKTQRLFNEEMLDTIQMFFDKDLNLSDASRQLYIHRNTLVYRLDKVLRQTGLDLRHFDDAITFQMLYLAGRGGQGSQGKAPDSGLPSGGGVNIDNLR